jgi:3-oxoacyl-[acyl-carrier-protein] synthase-1
MVQVIAHHIISPLGDGTDDNFQALLRGESSLQKCHALWGIPDDVVISRISDEQRYQHAIKGLTLFESLVVYSIQKALGNLELNANWSKHTLLIISSTKADYPTLPGITAQNIADYLGLVTVPIVVSNACISGVNAILLASRLLEIGLYDEAIVCGADILNRFIVSGFQSFRSLSSDPCRPFDINRNGLNLGEAVATVVLRKNGKNDNHLVKDESLWSIVAGAIRNDAFHISNPSPKGEGCYLALQSINTDDVISEDTIINAHATATLYNDQMEAKALSRAALSKQNINALKGYFGHTLGAAGIFETIITLYATSKGIILPTKGFTEVGVSGEPHIVRSLQNTSSNSFVKLISGFGGCNAAIKFAKVSNRYTIHHGISFHCSHRVTITPSQVVLDEEILPLLSNGKDLINEVYQSLGESYPRFHKMDVLSRLGYISSELLLKIEEKKKGMHMRFVERDDRAIILMNSHSSCCADALYEKSIANMAEYYPSPSLFVYTLPNIVTGEIAIRNAYHGETAFYVLPRYDEILSKQLIMAAFQDKNTKSILFGWIDAVDDQHFDVDLELIERESE